MKQFLFKVHLSDFYLFIEMMSTFHNIYHTATQGANTNSMYLLSTHIHNKYYLYTINKINQLRKTNLS